MADKKQQETTFIGKCNFRGNERVFGVKTKDRRQHMYVVGKTGTGKTVLLKNIALQDIRAGRGVAIIDPHGEFVEEVLAQIPPERTNDVIYFNPVDSEHPIGFNVLELSDPKYKHLVVSDLLGIFTKIWANVWSARMEYILQNCILALLDTPGTTLLGIPRLLVDKDYRQKIIMNVKDPVVRSFWVHEYETWRDQFRNEAIVPIQNKVNQFLNTPFIRNIVGQSKSTMNIPQIMNEGKILLVNVSKGRIGEDNSALLGAMIITKVQLAAMERVRIPEEDRNDFYLYVDEFQNFATDSFASILSEARKYRLNLILAHQYVGQLVTDVSTKVRDAVFGNVGTMIMFRVGAGDAEYLETEFSPEFLPADLINLPNYHIYLKLMVDGITSRPFSAVTIPPLKFETDTSVKEKIISVSRERYTSSRADVEEKIARWSGSAGDMGAITGDADDGKMFETTCWNCGKTATVPFKPDGKRPVYCLSCLRQIEDGKLIPLPERMPQVGRAKFGSTLGGLGIEFDFNPAEAARVPIPAGGGSRISAPVLQQDTRRPQPSLARPQAGPGLARPQTSPARPQVNQARPQVPQGLRQDGPRAPMSPQRPVVRSEPIVRTQAGAKPMSLSQLKPRGETKKESPQASVDVSGLRKALDAALGERASPRLESGRAAPAGASLASGREALKGENEERGEKKEQPPKAIRAPKGGEKKVIGPGETVKF